MRSTLIHLEPLEAEPGHWCPTCLLPSAFRCSWCLVNERDMPIATGSSVWCPECRR